MILGCLKSSLRCLSQNKLFKQYITKVAKSCQGEPRSSEEAYWNEREWCKKWLGLYLGKSGEWALGTFWGDNILWRAGRLAINAAKQYYGLGWVLWTGTRLDVWTLLTVLGRLRIFVAKWKGIWLKMLKNKNHNILKVKIIEKGFSNAVRVISFCPKFKIDYASFWNQGLLGTSGSRRVLNSLIRKVGRVVKKWMLMGFEY